MSETQIHDCRDGDCMVMTPHPCCGGPGCQTCSQRKSSAVSPGDLSARIEKLAEKWQQHAAICAANGYHTASTNLDQCADELLALLGAAQEQSAKGQERC
jgi:hypothetical protein